MTQSSPASPEMELRAGRLSFSNSVTSLSTTSTTADSTGVDPRRSMTKSSRPTKYACTAGSVDVQDTTLRVCFLVGPSGSDTLHGTAKAASMFASRSGTVRPDPGAATIRQGVAEGVRPIR